MYHEGYGGDDHQHHYRNGIEQNAQVDLQVIGKMKPGSFGAIMVG